MLKMGVKLAIEFYFFCFYQIIKLFFKLSLQYEQIARVFVTVHHVLVLILLSIISSKFLARRMHVPQYCNGSNPSVESNIGIYVLFHDQCRGIVGYFFELDL